MENEEISMLILQTNVENSWVSKKILLRFNESQYNALLIGYHPHWDMKYGIKCENDYFYNYRSGWIVGKFRVAKIEDDFYQVTEMYDNLEKNDWHVVFDSLVEACIQNNVQFDSDLLSVMKNKTIEMQDKIQ